MRSPIQELLCPAMRIAQNLSITAEHRPNVLVRKLMTKVPYHGRNPPLVSKNELFGALVRYPGLRCCLRVPESGHEESAQGVDP
jgi:hypothetical protein